MGQHPPHLEPDFLPQKGQEVDLPLQGHVYGSTPTMGRTGPLGSLASSLSTPLIFLAHKHGPPSLSALKPLGPYSGKGSLGSGLFLSPFPFCPTLLRVPTSARPGPPLLPSPVAPAPVPPTHASRPPSARPSSRPTAPRLLLPGLVSNLRASPGSPPGHVR